MCVTGNGKGGERENRQLSTISYLLSLSIHLSIICVFLCLSPVCSICYLSMCSSSLYLMDLEIPVSPGRGLKEDRVIGPAPFHMTLLPLLEPRSHTPYCLHCKTLQGELLRQGVLYFYFYSFKAEFNTVGGTDRNHCHQLKS